MQAVRRANLPAPYGWLRTNHRNITVRHIKLRRMAEVQKLDLAAEPPDLTKRLMSGELPSPLKIWNHDHGRLYEL